MLMRAVAFTIYLFVQTEATPKPPTVTSPVRSCQPVYIYFFNIYFVYTYILNSYYIVLISVLLTFKINISNSALLP